MALELATVAVREVEFGERTEVRAGRLRISREALVAVVRAAAPAIATIDVSLVRPGDATRLVCVKDVIEPRRKVAGARPGEGRVEALGGVAVATTGQIVGFQEGIIDMSGPGAAYTPFSALSLIALDISVPRDCEPHAHEAALRAAGLAAADFLAGAAATVEPDAVERFELAATTAGLPRIAYVYMLLSQGLLHDTWVQGRNARAGLPCRADPRLGFEGGIVSGNCVSACDKNTTWHHQHNALIRELFRRHGAELDFVGCVLTNEPVRLGDKEASARRAVELVCELAVDGAVISKEGFGNPDADLMMLVRGLEASGVRTVGLTDEFAGRDGASQSLADTTREADAIISVGNANECVVLPPMERTIGPLAQVSKLAGAGPQSAQRDASLVVELQALVGATNQIGHGRLTARGV